MFEHDAIHVDQLAMPNTSLNGAESDGVKRPSNSADKVSDQSPTGNQERLCFR